MTALSEYHLYDLTKDPDWEPQVSLLHGLVERLGDDLSGFHDVNHVGEIELIETSHFPGFIPTTNGGFDLVAYGDFASAHGSGSTPKAIEGMLEETLKDCERSFLKQNGLPEDKHPWDGDDVGEEVREDYWEFENTWLSEGTTYFYKVRVILYHPDNGHNETGKPEALILAGINTDLEYGRDHIPWLRHYGGNPQRSFWGYERTIPLEEITKELIEEIYEAALLALANA